MNGKATQKKKPIQVSLSLPLMIAIVLVAILLMVLGGAVALAASSTDSPGDPSSEAAKMYTLTDIYNRINDGTAGTKQAFQEPGAGPGTGTMKTLNDLYDLAGERSRVRKTGQTTCFTAASSYEEVCPEDSGNYPGQDGDYQKGVDWPNPRFTDNNDGTVTDNLTGLIWLKNAECQDVIGGVTFTASDTLDWQEALSYAAALENGYCGLSDGSSAGDWRLPNVLEMHSLINYGTYPALPDTAGTGRWSEGDPFTNVAWNYWYWTSTSLLRSFLQDEAWTVFVAYGAIDRQEKTESFNVWPVRGGQ